MVNEKNGNEDFLELYEYLSTNELLDKKHYINPGRIMFRTQKYHKQFYQDELNENKYFETMYNLFQKTGYKNCLAGGEYNILFKLYELFFENRSFLPNMKKCGATTGKRYIYYPDSHIYTCTEIAGEKCKAIGKYNPNYVLNNSKVSHWTKENTKLEGKCYTCKYMFICTGGCKVSTEKCPNIKGALDEFFDVIGECL